MENVYLVFYFAFCRVVPRTCLVCFLTSVKVCHKWCRVVSITCYRAVLCCVCITKLGSVTQTARNHNRSFPQAKSR